MLQEWDGCENQGAKNADVQNILQSWEGMRKRSDKENTYIQNTLQE